MAKFDDDDDYEDDDDDDNYYDFSPVSFYRVQ